MLEIGFYLWIILTLPIWLTISIVWLILKFIFFFIIYLYGLLTLSLDNIFYGLIRVIAMTFNDANVILDKFKIFYYENTGWAFVIGLILFLIYFGGSKNQR